MLSSCLLALILLYPNPPSTQSNPLQNQRAPDWMLWDAFFLHLKTVDEFAQKGWRSKEVLPERIGVPPECPEILTDLAKTYYATRDLMWQERKQLLARPAVITPA